ncbi:RNA 2',3'-cyclic phosphodiesterase [Flavisphingomonas formosensis]|uniref:RNA 2',3'-cyclic phosphodiesterase n=1 Tax=Flavisphingomonas formosensis TaxID=861534 RepID=UPI0012F825F6|nr:RNA 2',3'-cyclic phosphodiesterase [Sphingomonas formosensis]
MHRLFVAIRPPRPMRERLLGLMGGVAHARWQRDDQLHLTLRFIGEVDRHRAEDIVAALGTVHHPAFALALDGVGQFDRKGRADSLWVGVSPPEPARQLHNKIDQALVRVGLEPDTRAYLPHITIARFGRLSGPLGGLVSEAGGVSSDPYAMTEFCLYESDLGHDGSIYTIVERYRLD